MDHFRSFCAYLYKVNYAHLLILGLVVKALISDISYPTFLLTIPVLGFEAYKLYMRSKVQDPIKLDAELVKELENIKAKINANTFEKNVKGPILPNQRYF